MLTSAQVARLRLQSLGLAGAGTLASTASPADVVTHHLAMQAQDWPASRWAIGSRLAAAGAPSTESVITDAYNSQSIVRAWPMRGTVHAIACADLRWVNDLAGARVLSGVARRWQALGIDSAFMDRTSEAIVALLSDGTPRTRDDLARELARQGITLEGGLRYHVIWYLTQTGNLVLGPVDETSGSHAVVLQDQHLPQRQARPEADRERALVERYLASHGPAQLEDIVWWSGMTKTAIRRGVGALGELIVPLESNGREMMMLADRFASLDPDCPEAMSATLALPAFDEHLLGYKDRSDVLDVTHSALVDPGRNGVFRATVVDQGRVVAVWQRKPLTNHVRVTVSPVVRLTAARRARVTRAFEPWGQFVDRELEVRFAD